MLTTWLLCHGQLAHGSEFTSTGLQNGESIGSVSLASNGTAATATVSGGPYAITPSNASGGTFNPANYNISYVNGTLTITPAPLTITADDKSKVQTQPNPPLTATYSGFKLGQDASVLGGALLLTTTATTDSAAGDYPINASGQTSTNYNISYIDGTLTVTAALDPELLGVPPNAPPTPSATSSPSRRAVPTPMSRAVGTLAVCWVATASSTAAGKAATRREIKVTTVAMVAVATMRQATRAKTSAAPASCAVSITSAASSCPACRFRLLRVV